MLNPKRPIVAVHGAAGTGKSLLLAEYLNIMIKSNYNNSLPIAIISNSTTSLYRLINFYCNIAGQKTADFFIFKDFDYDASIYSITNPNVRKLVELASLYRFPKNWYSKRTLDSFERIVRQKQLKNGSRFILFFY